MSEAPARNAGTAASCSTAPSAGRSCGLESTTSGALRGGQLQGSRRPSASRWACLPPKTVPFFTGPGPAWCTPVECIPLLLSALWMAWRERLEMKLGCAESEASGGAVYPYAAEARGVLYRPRVRLLFGVSFLAYRKIGRGLWPSSSGLHFFLFHVAEATPLAGPMLAICKFKLAGNNRWSHFMAYRSD